MREKDITIHDVAREAGVSIATVSRALSGGSVSAEAREKVEAAIRTVGYTVPDGKGNSRAIALVISSQTNPYYASMCQGATEEATRAGYLPVFYSYPEGARCSQAVSDLLANRPAGVLLAGWMVENNEGMDQTRTALQRIQQAMPLVAIGPPIDGLECPRLTSDPSQCVRKSVAHLAMLGHRRVAFVGGDRTARFSNIRENTYLEEVERLGLVSRPDYVRLTGCTPPAGELGINMLLGGLERKDYPTAIFCINDMTALGALRQLHRMGLRVPEDMAVVGCDNTFFGQYLTPSLTSVDLHPKAHGRVAMAELIAMIQGGRAMSFNDSVEASLVVRESCGAHLGVRQFE